MTARLLLLVCLSLLPQPFLRAQAASASPRDEDAQLKFVVYLSRHGVRAPTAKNAQLNIYSSAPWPEWSVPAAYLTPHGYQLMKLFGAYDRLQLSHQGLLNAKGCADAGNVRFYADSDQRTRETGKAIVEGLFPGCSVPVQALAEGVPDPLFHLDSARATTADSALAAASIAGRIGGEAENLTAAYRSQLADLDKLLATCGSKPNTHQKRTSLFEIPAGLTPGSGDHAADLKGPLNTAATLTENMLLEYAEGMDDANVGWGCVDAAKLRTLLELHAAAEDLAQRTPAVARMQASSLLDVILRSMEQAANGRAVAGAISKPSDHAFFLIGHDTNIANVAGLLNIAWVIDGRRDDTPPGGALVFELWHSAAGEDFVRTYYTVQTLEQMRSATPLTLARPPQRVPVFLPGCSRKDFSCSWQDFSRIIHQAIDPRYVSLGNSAALSK